MKQKKVPAKNQSHFRTAQVAVVLSGREGSPAPAGI